MKKYLAALLAMWLLLLITPALASTVTFGKTPMELPAYEEVLSGTDTPFTTAQRYSDFTFYLTRQPEETVLVIDLDAIPDRVRVKSDTTFIYNRRPSSGQIVLQLP